MITGAEACWPITRWHRNDRQIMTASKKPALRTVDFKADERNVFFHILTGCNLTCKHCYINREQHGTEMLPLEKITKWLKLFYDPKKESNVIFLGGEPTMHPDLARAVKEAQKMGYDSITVDTNGFLFHDLLENIEPSEAVLSFSLDGPDAATNDAIRGKGVFNTCTGNLKKAVEKGFKVSVIYTVSRKNIQALPKMAELLEKLGVTRFFIQVIGLRGKSAAEGDDLQLTPDEWLEQVPPVAADTANRGIKTIYPKVFLDTDEQFSCAGNVAENFFIFPNGRVYRCPLCEDFPIHSLVIEGDKLLRKEGITEEELFSLDIPEGCVMNKLLQPGNICYDQKGEPLHRVSCCLLKQEIGD